jgi:hypothetical protein
MSKSDERLLEDEEHALFGRLRVLARRPIVARSRTIDASPIQTEDRVGRAGLKRPERRGDFVAEIVKVAGWLGGSSLGEREADLEEC